MNNACGLLIALLLMSVAAADAQLPPEIQVDRLLLRVERIVEAEETGEALEVVQEILTLQEEHGIQLPPRVPLPARAGDVRGGDS